MDEQQEFRLATAKAALEVYEEWLNGAAADWPRAVADLASAARWYVESLEQADVTVGEC